VVWHCRCKGKGSHNKTGAQWEIPGEYILPLPPDMITPEALVEDLAGCLGQESAAAYDFDLKLGGLYEAR
jgi:hypothetical protein